jgi:hypothetical protein
MYMAYGNSSSSVLRGVGFAENGTEVDVAELLALPLITLEIVDAEPVWLVVLTPPPFSSVKIVGRLVKYMGFCVPVASKGDAVGCETVE